MATDKLEQRENYFHFMTIATRWKDNDIYGHVNNVVYYSYFDTAVNMFLVEQGGLDMHKGEVVGVVVESKCNYKTSIAFPEVIEAGLRVEHLGNSSVRYGIGIFKENLDTVAAWGHFVHVFVNRGTNQATPMPPKIREALQTLLIPQ